MEVIAPAERRDLVRRLIALCHVVNDLVDLAENGPTADSANTPTVAGHAQQIQTALRDAVVDLVANGRAGHPDAA